MVGSFLLQLDYPVEVNRISAKILYWTLVITGFLFANCYAATLTSYLAIAKFELSITSLWDVYNKKLNMIVPIGTATEFYFSGVKNISNKNIVIFYTRLSNFRLPKDQFKI